MLKRLVLVLCLSVMATSIKHRTLKSTHKTALKTGMYINCRQKDFNCLENRFIGETGI